MNDSTGTEKPADIKEASAEYDIETYRHAIEEARRTLDQQLEAFNDVADKAWRIVKLNGIIATIYVAAVANALDDLTFTLIQTIFIGFGLTFNGDFNLFGCGRPGGPDGDYWAKP